MINIVGTGLAGMSAAIALAEKGRECNLISYQEAERAQSVMAEGGINASLNTMNENASYFYSKGGGRRCLTGSVSRWARS